MAEYIDREALLKRMETRLNQLRGEYGNYDHYTDGFDEALVTVEEAPTADVVEVVRCKDCKYCTPYEAANGCTFCKCDYIKFSGFLLDDYCSYGERKV